MKEGKNDDFPKETFIAHTFSPNFVLFTELVYS